MQKIKDFLKSALASLDRVRHNLPAIRKEIVSAVTSAASVVALCQTLAPQVSGNHQALFATIAGVLSGAVTLLTRNDVVDEIDNLSKL